MRVWGDSATIYAEVRGAGISNDAHDIAQPDPEGRGGTRAIKMAQEAGLDHTKIADIEATGPGGAAATCRWG